MVLESYSFFRKINPFIFKVIYLQGMPNVNKTFTVKFLPDTNGIRFEDASNKNYFIYLEKSKIKNILVADQSTIENRVGFKRLLLVGIFAFAWKKREKTPLSFLIIEYENEFNEIQEIYFQSEIKEGFQNFTNIKYNLQKFWKDAENNPNINEDLADSEKSVVAFEKQQESNVATGCLILIAILVILVIFYFSNL